MTFRLPNSSEGTEGSLVTGQRPASKPEPKLAPRPVRKPEPPAPPVHVDDVSPPPGPTSFFGSKDVSGNYDFAKRGETPLLETLETSFDVGVSQQSMAIGNALRDKYAEYASEIEEATGVRPFNPYSESGYGRKEIIERRERGEDVAGLSQQDAAIQRFHREVSALREKFPELPIRNHDDFVAQVSADRQDVLKRRAHAAAGEQGIISGGAAFLGNAAGAIVDPINLVTLPMGAPWSAGLLRVIATEAAIGVGSEAVIQGIHQTSRPEIGERPDLGEAVSNVALVGVTAGAIGGAAHGIARGVARGAEFLRERRANLSHAEALPAAQRTNDIEAAIAVERRALDIEEANPFGHDREGASVHARRYADAERALAAGEVIPRRAANAPRLVPADADVLSSLARAANDQPEAFAAEIAAMRNLPQDLRDASETLAEFVYRDGNEIAEINAAIARDGATPERMARLTEEFEALAQHAADEGFFTDGKPTVAQLVEAMADETEHGRVLHRVTSADIPAEEIKIARAAEILRRNGIDVDALEPAQVAARVRHAGEALERSQSNRAVEGASNARPADADATARSQARFEEAEASTATERQAELDEIREQQIRDAFAGKEDTKIMIEDEDGTVRPLSVREIFEDATREADELEAIRVCASGSAWR